MPRLIPETIPWVTESVKVPSGLPIAIASWPTWIVLESPSVTGVSPVALILIRARSCWTSVATTVAGILRVSSRTTVKVDAPVTTWLLVRIKPPVVMMKPEPAPEDGTEIVAESVVMIVTTDGLTCVGTRTIASGCVIVTC